MVHTFLGLQNQVLSWLDEAGDTGTTRQNIRNAINEAQQQRLMQFAWRFLVWDRAETLTMTSTIQAYSLHQEFNRPLYFRNRTTGEYFVETPNRNIEPSMADWTNDVTGNRFTLWGRSPVKFQPSSASVLTIVSDDALDTGADYGIVIRGETSAGDIRASIISPSGTTPVAGTVSYVKILSVTKAQAWNGNLTITSNSGAVTNLTLYDCEFGRFYPQFYILSQPTSGDIVEYKFFRQPLPLMNDFDIPELPAPFSQVLVWDALILLMAYDKQLDPSRAATFGGNAQKWEDEMIAAFSEGQSLGAEPKFMRDRSTVARPYL